jgi:hypothetical protein
MVMTTLVVKHCQVDSLPPQTVADPGSPAEVTPRLWAHLPPAVQNQLAQQLAQLLRRLRSASGPPKEMYDAERSIGG